MTIQDNNNMRINKGAHFIPDSVNKLRQPPRTKKDFQRLVEDDKENPEEEADIVENATGKRSPKIGSKDKDHDGETELPSLLSLSAQKESDKLKLKSSKNEDVEGEESQINKLPSPFSALKGVSERDAKREEMADSQDNAKKSPISSLNQPNSSNASVKKSQGKESPFSIYNRMSKETKENDMQFTREQPDLSHVNQMAPAGNFALADGQAATKAPYIKQITLQIIEKLTVLETQGKTETIVTLKHPPLLEGAHIVLTGFDSAAKEFNIAFENLSNQAKHILDLKQNQEDLKMSLAEKGFTVHIIVTTTVADNRTFDQGRGREDRNEQNPDGRQKKRDDEQEQDA